MRVVDSVGDWFRIVVALSSMVVCLLMILRLLKVWPNYSVSQKMIFSAVFLYNLNYVGRTTQLLFQDGQPFNFWLFLILMGNTAMVVFLMEPQAKYEGRFGMDMLRPPPKS